MPFDKFGLDVEGVNKLFRRLKRLDDKMRKKVLRQSIRDQAKGLKTTVQTLAPVGTDSRNPGALRRTIHIRRSKFKDKTMVGDLVLTGTRQMLGIPQNAKGYYPAVVEYGSSRVGAQPYMRPAASIHSRTFVTGVGIDVARFVGRQRG